VDLGCGTGLCGVWLRGRAARLVGVDLSARMLEIAAARRDEAGQPLYDQVVQEDVGVALAAMRNIELVVAADVSQQRQHQR